MDLRSIFLVIRRRIGIIVVITILALAVVVVLISRMKPSFEASVVLYIQSNPDSNSTNYNLIMAGEQLAQTYSEVLKGQTVLQTTINELQLSTTVVDLTEDVIVEQVKGTQLIKVKVKNSSAEQAALIANTIAQNFIAQIQALQSERYTVSMRKILERLASEQATIADLQAQMDIFNAESVGLTTDLDQQKLLLTDLRSDLRSAEKNAQVLNLAMAQLSDSVKITEEARTLFPGTANTTVVTVMVAQPPAAEGSDFAMTRSSDQLALTFSQMVTSRVVLDETIQKLELPFTVDQLAVQINAQPIAGTQLITISLVSSLPEKRLEIANTLAAVFVNHARGMIAEPYQNRLTGIQDQKLNLQAAITLAQEKIKTLTEDKIRVDTNLSRLNADLLNHNNTIRSLQNSYDQMSGSSSTTTDTVVVAEAAQIPEEPVDHRLVYLVIAIAMGGAGGIGLAFLLEHLEDRLYSRHDVESALCLNVLGTIGRLPVDSQELYILEAPTSQITEDFRILAINIRLHGTDKPIRRLMVASPSAQEGKSVVTANLAVALARTGLKVVVVDADLRVPHVHRIFNCQQSLGLTDAMLINRSLNHFLKPTAQSGLSILTSGSLPSDPLDIFNSPQFPPLLDRIDQKADLVLFDSPAILSLADSSVLATRVDGVILVVRAGKTNGQDAKEAVARLQQAAVPVVGVVLNGITSRSNYYNYNRQNRFGVRRMVRVGRRLAEQISSDSKDLFARFPRFLKKLFRKT